MGVWGCPPREKEVVCECELGECEYRSLMDVEVCIRNHSGVKGNDSICKWKPTRTNFLNVNPEMGESKKKLI